MVRGVLGRRRPAAGVAGPGDPHADLDLAPGLPEDARRVQAAELVAQEVGRAGDGDRGPFPARSVTIRQSPSGLTT